MNNKKTLFESTNIKNLDIKNRTFRSALWMNMAEESGHLNENIIKTYEDLAKGGAGLIFTGYAFISDDEQPNSRMLGVSNDSFINGYKELVERVHNAGSKIALQLAYGGTQNYHPDVQNMNILTPSNVKNRVTGVTPKEASKEDIRNIVKKFGDAAVRAKEAGFDSVQLHAAHGYFVSQFLTPYYNRRKDEYNGTIHDRARIIYEIIPEVRKRVGEDYPLMIKLNHDDFMDEGEGLTKDESMEIFKKVDKLGIDVIEVSAVNESSGKGLAPAMTRINSIEKQSYFKEFTSKLANEVDAKVILMGGNRNIDLMEDILNSTNIEYFSIARPLLAEPDLIKKWQEDRNYKPRCVSCNQCPGTQPVSCIFNRKK